MVLRRFPRRLGLRSRVTMIFFVGAFAIAAVMASVAYLLAHNYLLGERQSSARRQAFANARLVRSELRAPSADITVFLGTVPTGSESSTLVYRRGHWFASSVAVSPTELPNDVVADAIAGTAATQRFAHAGTTYLVVAVPIPAVDAVYVQVFSLRELNSTLHILSASLSVAALVTAIAGAMIGVWASKLALQPVRDVAAAAGNIAEGNLETRLRVTEDPGLARLAKAFNSMVDALQARLARDAQFASDVSHELRSPLTTLATSLTVLERHTEGWRESQLQALELVKSETAAFQRLVEDLLEMSRVDAGATTLVPDEVFAGEFLCQVAASLRPGVAIDIAPDAGQVFVQIDKRRMERVFANLVENADRYAGGVVRFGLRRTTADELAHPVEGNGAARDGRSARAGRAPAARKARHRWRRRAGRLSRADLAGSMDAVAPALAIRYEVDDAGPGIPDTDREHIFERFARGGYGYRASGSGVGLGLALVAEHVAMHNGRVWAEERPGGGARFVIALPADDA